MATRRQGLISLLLLAAIVAVYNLHGLFPDPPLAFYIARGWMGVLLAWALWRGLRFSDAVLAVLAFNEAATSACGAMYAGVPVGFAGMCDAGTGTPVNLLGLTASLLALAVTIRTTCTDENRGENG